MLCFGVCRWRPLGSRVICCWEYWPFGAGLLPLSLGALAFSLYLAHIEKYILGVWCIYCVASLGVITAFSLLVVGTVLSRGRLKSFNHEGH
jgi:uncharacterized membrane protein